MAAHVSDPAAAALLATDGFELRFVPYDWELNGTLAASNRAMTRAHMLIRKPADIRILGDHAGTALLQSP